MEFKNYDEETVSRAIALYDDHSVVAQQLGIDFTEWKDATKTMKLLYIETILSLEEE